MGPSNIDAVIVEFLPICKALAEGRYAVSIGGSRARKTSDELSDIDFRLFCDAVIHDQDERSRLKAQLDASIQRWAERGVIIDGCWIRDIQETSARLEEWCAGTGAPEPLVWAVWGYYLPTDIYLQTVVDDPYGVIAAWKEQLRTYPLMLKDALLKRHLASVRYWKDDYHYRNKVERKDIVFLASLATKLVHDMVQILFALNETYYVGDGYNLTVLQRFEHVPGDFVAKVEEALYPRHVADMLEAQRGALVHLIGEVEALAERLGVDG